MTAASEAGLSRSVATGTSRPEAAGLRSPEGIAGLSESGLPKRLQREILGLNYNISGVYMNAQSGRIVVSLAMVGLVLAAIVTFPAWKYPNLLPLLLIDFAVVYVTFLISASLSHLMLRMLKLQAAWHYFVVMLVISFILHMALQLWSISGYAELYYSGTEVIKNSGLTTSGLRLQIRESGQSAGLFALLFVVFWYLTVHRNPIDA